MSSEFKFLCPLRYGLHARPATQLANLANSFSSDCVLINLRTTATANLNSVLSIIAADVQFNDECLVKVSGDDRLSAHSALQRFVTHDLPHSDDSLPEPAAPQPSIKLPRALRSEPLDICYGALVSPGIGEGKAVIVGSAVSDFSAINLRPASASQEQERVQKAIAAVESRIEALLARSTTEAERGVLQAHLAILRDTALAHEINGSIARGRSAGQAVTNAIQHFVGVFRDSGNAYICERAVDLQEISFALLEEMYGPLNRVPVQLREPSIVVADNLAPQQLLSLDRTLLNGLVLKAAGATSHAMILARSLGIPALAGVAQPLSAFTQGEHLIVDANRGFAVRNGTQTVLRFYQGEMEMLNKRQARLLLHATQTVLTRDNRQLEVAANISSPSESDTVFRQGADGVGLFRTEMLFLHRESAPSEQEQFEAYLHVVRAAGDKPVIIRTLDIGGDKQLGYLNLPAEPNPFLGYRGMRIYRDHPQLVNDQLRAIICASAFGRIHMMLPMVTSVEEVLWIKERIADNQARLRAEQIGFDSAMPLGAMIEVPSTAFIMDQLSNELDFFSIGTNDLSQYFFAADRTNPKVAALSNLRQPSFLRLLRHIVDAAHRNGKWIGMCGQMAGEAALLPLLLGLGLDEISVPSSEIPGFKERISKLSFSDCQKLLAAALDCQTADEVTALLSSARPHDFSRPLLDEALVIVNSSSRNREEAIRELVEAMYVHGRTEDPDSLEDAIWSREETYSTGLGFGFAVPHAKTTAVNAASIAVLRLETPVDWGSLDNQPVNTVVLLAASGSDSQGSQLQFFAKLARKLVDEKFRQQLTQTQEPRELVRFLSGELDLK